MDLAMLYGSRGVALTVLFKWRKVRSVCCEGEEKR